MAGRARDRFPSTHWSLVISAGGASAEAGRALAELCETYWYPVYAFLRRKGRSHDDAADLTQAFFARMLEKRYLKDADPDRGRFRSFLLASLCHFMSNDRDWQQALKRGGGLRHVPIELATAEERYSLEPADDLTPERLYERRWTLAVLDKAMSRLARKYDEAGRGEVFQRLKPGLTGDNLSYRQAAEELGVKEGSLRVAAHRLRNEFGEMLRSTIAETVDRPTDVDDELRYLLDVIGRSK
jgi:RNA polymerase sigma-70 factor (ECF subfamily)